MTTTSNEQQARPVTEARKWWASLTQAERDELIIQAWPTATSSGIGFGAALAIVISWSQWHSLLWATAHGLLGWIYVIYFAFKDGRL